jgi:endonuclease IV
MKVGIKFGPSEGIDRLQKSGAKYAEVYFRLDWKEKYTELFEYMRQNEVQFGLHFWALVKGKYNANLAYNRDGIADESERLIKETIDIAAENGAYYVNYHPDSLRLKELDLDKQEFRLVPGAEVTESKGFETLLHHSENLKEYGEKKGIKTYVETVPIYDPSHFREDDKQSGRLNPVKVLGFPTRQLIELGKRGFDICFDIAHAACQYPDETKEIIFEKTLKDAKEIAPYTKLVHINTFLPPFNGTDSHNGILEDDFSQDVFPDREQYDKILGVFKQYPDIWYIPEPQIDKMVENYFELKKLLS